MNFQDDLDELGKVSLDAIKDKARQFDLEGKPYRIEFDILTKWRVIDEPALEKITVWLRAQDLTVVEVNTDNRGVIIVSSIMSHGSTCDEIHRHMKAWLNENFQVFVSGPRMVWGKSVEGDTSKK